MVEHVFLVGVAGGVACFDDDTRHVRRGDVIVSRPAQTGGAIYMQIVSRDDDSSQSCLSWAARDPALSDIAAKLTRKPKTFYKRLDQFITDGLLHSMCLSLLITTRQRTKWALVPLPAQSATIPPEFLVNPMIHGEKLKLLRDEVETKQKWL